MTITELKNVLIATGVYAEIDDVDEVVRVYESEDAPRADDKKYILPLEETEHTNTFGNTRKLYAYRLDSGTWTVCFGGHMHNLVERGAYVTAKDLDNAPDWVKAIQPVEVNE